MAVVCDTNSWRAGENHTDFRLLCIEKRQPEQASPHFSRPQHPWVLATTTTVQGMNGCMDACMHA